MVSRETLSYASLAIGFLVTAHYFQLAPQLGGAAQQVLPATVVSEPPIALPRPPVAPSSGARRSPDETLRPEKPSTTSQEQEAWPDSDIALSIEIQKELKRLGCYVGRADGRWTSAVREAVEELNGRLNAKLPTDGPDEAQLALGRSQITPVCAPLSPGVQASAGARTIAGDSPETLDQELTPDQVRPQADLARTSRMLLGAQAERPRKAFNRGMKRSPQRRWAQERFIHPLGRQ